MKQLMLTKEYWKTLHDMGIFHTDARTRQRAQAIVRLAQGLTYKQLAQEFDVHLSTVNEWVRRWERAGLVGLIGRQHSGRPPKLTVAVLEQVHRDAQDQGGTIVQMRRHLQTQAMALSVHETTLSRHLKKMNR